MSDARTKIEIYFDQQNQSIEVVSPGGQSVRMSDASSSVTLEDSNGNVVSVGPEGVRIESVADVIIRATGAVRIEAQSISLSASTTLSAFSSGNATVSSDGELAIAGALVAIN
jgi:hypothetical protein